MDEKRYAWGPIIPIGDNTFTVALVEDPNGPLRKLEEDGAILFVAEGGES